MEESADPQELESRREEAEREFAAAQQLRYEARAHLDLDSGNRTLQKELDDELEKQQREYTIWWRLRELIGSARGDSFRRFAQGLTLDYLIRLANRHLQRFSGRYRLKRESGEELSMQIVDTWQADTLRPVETLSGGETFLASLSLALGLSELAGRKTRIDSLFLDEGFGSLDAETLETVIAALETLRSAGKLIGIISHVEALKERIPVQIRVQRRGTGYSTLSVVP
jgi:exonuclease SbcC